MKAVPTKKSGEVTLYDKEMVAASQRATTSSQGITDEDAGVIAEAIRELRDQIVRACTHAEEAVHTNNYAKFTIVLASLLRCYREAMLSEAAYKLKGFTKIAACFYTLSRVVSKEIEVVRVTTYMLGVEARYGDIPMTREPNGSNL